MTIRKFNKAIQCGGLISTKLIEAKNENDVLSAANILSIHENEIPAELAKELRMLLYVRLELLKHKN